MSAAQSLELRQIPPARRAYNPDRSRVVGWYVARHDEDRYDEVTEYRVALFDVETEEELVFLVSSVHERADTGVKEGEHLASAAFDPADEDVVILRFVDGSERRRRFDDVFDALKRRPEDHGGVMTDAEKRVRERMRVRAEKLRRKPKPPPPPGVPLCAQCRVEINKKRDHHCPACPADYCATCCVSGEWKSVAAGVDYQYLDLRCPKGHAWREDSYL